MRPRGRNRSYSTLLLFKRGVSSLFSRLHAILLNDLNLRIRKFAHLRFQMMELGHVMCISPVVHGNRADIRVMRFRSSCLHVRGFFRMQIGRV